MQQTHQRDHSSPIRGGQMQNIESPNQPNGYNYEYDGEGSPEQVQGSATEKLVNSRQNRKKAEEDVKLLANRIALLKKEEQKAWKKIEDTKKKAKDIVQVKQRNQETNQSKQQLQQEKEEQLRMQAQKIEATKQQVKEGIQVQKDQHYSKIKEEADRVKNEKREQKEYAQMLKQQEQLKNASMKQYIKNSESELLEKKQKDAQEKRAKTRAELQQKIIEENQRRLEVEAEIARLEKEELKLIQNLQNTQILQKAAYEDLEGALSGQGLEQQNSSSGFQRDMSPMKENDQKGRPTTQDKRTPQNASGKK